MTPDRITGNFASLVPVTTTHAELVLLSIDRMVRGLVAGSAGLGDDSLEFVDLRLGTSEGTELYRRDRLGYLFLVAYQMWYRFGRKKVLLSSWRAFALSCLGCCGAIQ